MRAKGVSGLPRGRCGYFVLHPALHLQGAPREEMTTGDSERFKHGYRSIAEYLMADMAASRAKPPPAESGSGLGGVTLDDFRRVQAAIAAGRWRADVQAKAWVGYAVAAALGLDPKANRAKISAMLKAWVASGALAIVEGVEDRRARRAFIETGAPADG